VVGFHDAVSRKLFNNFKIFKGQIIFLKNLQRGERNVIIKNVNIIKFKIF